MEEIRFPRQGLWPRDSLKKRQWIIIRFSHLLQSIFDLVLNEMVGIIAFLYDILDEKIFIKQPLSFMKKGQENLVLTKNYSLLFDRRSNKTKSLTH